MNNKEIEEDIKKINEYIHDWYDNLTDEDGYAIETLNEDSKEFVQAIENILADREKLLAKANKYDRLAERIEKVKNSLEKDGFVGYADELMDILEEE